jgi:hypothetical protein
MLVHLTLSALLATAAASQDVVSTPVASSSTDRILPLFHHAVDATRMEDTSFLGSGFSLSLWTATSSGPLIASASEIPKNKWIFEKPPREKSPSIVGRIFNRNQKTPVVEYLTAQPSDGQDISESRTIPTIDWDSYKANARSIIDSSTETYLEPVQERLATLQSDLDAFCVDSFESGAWMLQYLPPGTVISNGAALFCGLVTFAVAAYMLSYQYTLAKMARKDGLSVAKRRTKLQAEMRNRYEMEEDAARDQAMEANDSFDDDIMVMDQIHEDETQPIKDPKLLYPIDEEEEESAGDTISLSDEESTVNPPRVKRTRMKDFPKSPESGVPAGEMSDNESSDSGSLTTKVNGFRSKDPNPADDDLSTATPSKKKRNRFFRIKTPLRRKTPRRRKQKND